MFNVVNVVSYLFLFIALCVFVFLCIALINIFNKSYQPKAVAPFVFIIIALFLYNTLAGYGALRKTVQSLNKSINETITPVQTPNNAPAGSIF